MEVNYFLKHNSRVRCVLIVEALMRQDDVAAATRAILQMPAAAPA